MPSAREPWNHNIHYHRLVLDAIREGCASALDIGCGEGILARDLRRRVPSVVAIDTDPPSIELARQQNSSGVDYILGDVLTYPLPHRVVRSGRVDRNVASHGYRDGLAPHGGTRASGRHARRRGVSALTRTDRPSLGRARRDLDAAAQADQDVLGTLGTHRLAAARHLCADASSRRSGPARGVATGVTCCSVTRSRGPSRLDRAHGSAAVTDAIPLNDCDLRGQRRWRQLERLPHDAAIDDVMQDHAPRWRGHPHRPDVSVRR